MNTPEQSFIERMTAPIHSIPGKPLTKEELEVVQKMVEYLEKKAEKPVVSLANANQSSS